MVGFADSVGGGMWVDDTVWVGIFAGSSLHEELWVAKFGSLNLC